MTAMPTAATRSTSPPIDGTAHGLRMAAYGGSKAVSWTALAARASDPAAAVTARA